MFKKLNYKIISVVFMVLLCICITIGNFCDFGIFSKNKVNLGLDLKGGSHLLLQVDFNYYLNEQLSNDLDSLKNLFLESRLKALPKLENNTITIFYKNIDNITDIKQAINNINENFTIKEDKNNNRTLLLNYKDNYVTELRKKVNRESVEIIRKRIDEFGTKDSLIQIEGDDKILIQIAGLTNSSELKELIGKTAKLTFHIVSDDEKDNIVAVKMLDSEYELNVIKKPAITGDLLVDAGVSYDNNKPMINFKFNSIGAKKFADITKDNMGNMLAIVLDDKVITAPRINGKIEGGSGVISGNFSVEEASKIALLLKSGSLSAPLNIIEEKTVGATLGQDLIEQGVRSCVFGLILIIAFIFIFYKNFGIFSNIVLLINISVLITLLSLFDITLTLPGIAGIILTIGMSTDATILIFERIKEEYKKNTGLSSLEVIEKGFNNTMSTIFDSNITTIIVALILYIFGTGAIKGFAVILMLGIVSSIFSSVVCLKIILNSFYKNRILLIK